LRLRKRFDLLLKARRDNRKGIPIVVGREEGSCALKEKA